MINSIPILTIASALLSMSMPASAAEEYEMLISEYSEMNTLTLAKGESAKLVYAQQTVLIDRSESRSWHSEVPFIVTTRGKTFVVQSTNGGSGTQSVAPIVIPGPATIQMRPYLNPPYAAIATFAVTRVGTASPPAEVPQEAGSNFDVILEQSSDLVNWTPANPGTYSGTETKRFFRTRIVKKQ
jgi:hypothetical protein